MTQTYSTTETWSRTHARYVAGKVAADLRQMQQEYGKPTDQHLSDLLEELVTYLADDYLDYVEYGFRRDDSWVVGHKYTAAQLGSLSTDDRSGSIRRGADITGAFWWSYLVLNSRWWSLSQAERNRYETGIAIKRTSGSDASVGSNGWTPAKAYFQGGGGVHRSDLGGNQ